MRTHIIRHPNIQDHALLARRIHSMAFALMTSNKEDMGHMTLVDVANDHERKVQVLGIRHNKFIFRK